MAPYLWAISLINSEANALLLNGVGSPKGRLRPLRPDFSKSETSGGAAGRGRGPAVIENPDS